MEKVNRRRTRTEVIREILDEACDSTNKTRLMYRCNLNFMRFNRYLRDLLESGLIAEVEENPSGSILYKTTEKGHELLNVLRRVKDLIPILVCLWLYPQLSYLLGFPVLD